MIKSGKPYRIWKSERISLIEGNEEQIEGNEEQIEGNEEQQYDGAEEGEGQSGNEENQ